MITGNEPAMPTTIKCEGDLTLQGGLTIRQKFSETAMAAMLYEYVKQPTPAIIEIICAKSVVIADALIAELNKEKP